MSFLQHIELQCISDFCMRTNSLSASAYIKARILPVKIVMIPRAKLVVAVILRKYIKHIAKLLKLFTDKLFTLTDFMIVLYWLQKTPSALKTFVGNRESSVQEHLPSSHLRPVLTDQNPVI